MLVMKELRHPSQVFYGSTLAGGTGAWLIIHPSKIDCSFFDIALRRDIVVVDFFTPIFSVSFVSSLFSTTDRYLVIIWPYGFTCHGKAETFFDGDSVRISCRDRCLVRG